MPEETHRSHQGPQACLQRTRDVFFWPAMSAQLKELIDKCSLCRSVKRRFGRRTKTLLPLLESLLKTDKSVGDLLKGDRVKQAKYFNQQSKHLSELKSGDLVRMKLLGKTQ